MPLPLDWPCSLPVDEHHDSDSEPSLLIKDYALMLSFKSYPDDPPAFRVVIFAPKSRCLEATHLVYVAWKTVTHSRRCGFNIARTDEQLPQFPHSRLPLSRILDFLREIERARTTHAFWGDRGISKFRCCILDSVSGGDWDRCFFLVCPCN